MDLITFGKIIAGILKSADLTSTRNILLVVIFAIVVRWLLTRAVSGLFGKVRNRIKNEKTLARSRTARSLIGNLLDIFIFTVALIMVLSNLGINIGPLLAGAGILGLAISFGSQTLVKDVIAGVFIILEEQFNVGDNVKISGYEGVVHRLSLRTTVLRDKDENLIFIPNSQITSVVRQKVKKT